MAHNVALPWDGAHAACMQTGAENASDTTCKAYMSMEGGCKGVLGLGYKHLLNVYPDDPGGAAVCKAEHLYRLA